MTPGSKHNDEHDEAQKKVFRGYGFRPGGKNLSHSVRPKSDQQKPRHLALLVWSLVSLAALVVGSCSNS